MKFMERDDRNALRSERELRKKYLKQFAKKNEKKTTTNSLSPGFEKFKRESVMASHALLGFHNDRKPAKSMSSAKDNKKLSVASAY